MHIEPPEVRKAPYTIMNRGAECDSNMGSRSTVVVSTGKQLLSLQTCVLLTDAGTLATTCRKPMKQPKSRQLAPGEIELRQKSVITEAAGRMEFLHAGMYTGMSATTHRPTM